MSTPLEQLHLRSLAHLSHHLRELLEQRLWLKIVIGMVLGVLVGVLLGPGTDWVPPADAAVVGEWLALPGLVFLGGIQMIVVPLVIASIIRGLAAGEDLEQLRRLGLRGGAWFVATTTVAVTLGMSAVALLRPGRFVTWEGTPPTGAGAALSGPDELADAPVISEVPGLISGLIPDNPLRSMVAGEMLQVVLFSIVFGVALVSMRSETARPLLELLGSLQEVCMTVVKWAMRLAPAAVFGLMARMVLTTGLEALVGVAAYAATVLGALALMIVIYTVAAAVLGGIGPRTFLAAAREPQLLAFSTSSSAAVMPLTIEAAEEDLGLRPSIVRFVVPLGATVNMDGTALYQGAATVFLAQVTGVDLGPGALVIVVLTAVGASIGSPSTPGVGIVLLAMVLESAGIPAEAIVLVLGADRLLDMARTVVNVTGDLTACVVLDRRVGGSPPSEQVRAASEARDARRAASGEDVIVEGEAG